MIHKTISMKKFLSNIASMFALAVLVAVSPAQALPTDPGFNSANNILFYDPNAAECNASSGTTGPLNGEGNLQKIYNYFIGKGLSDVQAAGVVGNISQESGGYPMRKQGRPASEEYPDPSKISGGWGLIQWTPGSKVIGIAKQAGITGDISKLETQLDIVWWHMNETSPTGRKNFVQGYKQVTEVRAATLAFEQGMEGAGNPQMTNRYAAAELALSTYPKDPSTSTDTSSGCTCDTGANGTGSAVDVLLDPGHSGVNKQGQEIDAATKLYIGDSNNTPEKDQMWDTAQKVKAALEAKGYVVKMTKNSANDYVNLADRAKMANELKPQLAVSLHNTPGKFGDVSTGWVAAQKVGLYRKATNGKQVTFKLGGVALKSEGYAQKMVEARRKAEGGAQLHLLSFDGRAGLSPGNIPVVQLLSTEPWIYNEVGQDGFDATKYATGITDGIVAAIQPSSSKAENNNPQCSGAASGNAVQTAINYAWPEYHKPNYTNKKPSYQKAVDAAVAAGKYVGGGMYPGVDCGGFVTRVLQDSGVDPDYNKAKGPTTTQLAYAKSSSKWQQIYPKTSADVTKYEFAVAINSTHTYMYIGKHAGFETTVASASFSPSNTAWRAPMAGYEAVGDPKFEWFVLK